MARGGLPERGPRAAVPATPGRSRGPRSTTPGGFWRLMSALAIGVLWVDRTRTERIEKVFARMGDAELATSTIDHTWDYLNQACRHALRRQRIRTNPVQDALLPEARPPKERKALTVDQAKRILFDAIPDDRNPAMWLTGLMCGLRPGELAGLRWPYRRHRRRGTVHRGGRTGPGGEPEVRGPGQPQDQEVPAADRFAPPPGRRLATSPPRYADARPLRPGSFVFCTRNGTPFLLRNMRRDFGRLCERAGLGATGRPTSCATPSCRWWPTSSTTW